MITLTTEQAQQIEEALLRVEQNADECMGDDGMVMVVPLDLYNELTEALSIIRAARAQKKGPKPPKWYTREEIIQVLGRMNYCETIAQELADWFVMHLQHAFNKGFEVGQREMHAAPVRTKALTLREIEKCICDANEDPIIACRNAIAADRRRLNEHLCGIN